MCFLFYDKKGTTCNILFIDKKNFGGYRDGTLTYSFAKNLFKAFVLYVMQYAYDLSTMFDWNMYLHNTHYKMTYMTCTIYDF